jgi:hypothetical protein
MECAPWTCTSRFLWSCYLAQSYGDEEVAQADMWVPINLAKAGSPHMRPNVTSSLMSLGRVGRGRAAGHGCWLLGWLLCHRGREGEVGRKRLEHRDPGLVPRGWGCLRSSLRSFFWVGSGQEHCQVWSPPGSLERTWYGVSYVVTGLLDRRH